MPSHSLSVTPVSSQAMTPQASQGMTFVELFRNRPGATAQPKYKASAAMFAKIASRSNDPLTASAIVISDWTPIAARGAWWTESTPASAFGRNPSRANA